MKKIQAIQLKCGSEHQWQMLSKALNSTWNVHEKKKIIIIVPAASDQERAMIKSPM